MKKYLHALQLGFLGVLFTVSLVISPSCGADRRPTGEDDTLEDPGKSERRLPPDTQEIEIAFLVGRVEVAEPGMLARPARVGMRLMQSSEVRTIGTNSRCDMRLASGSEIRLSGDTALKLAQLYKDGKLDVEKTGLEMLTGQILVKVKPLLKDEEFSVRTRTALAGVRGTEFVVEDTPEETSVYVNSGAVQVSRNIHVDVDGDPELSREVSREIQQETAVTVQPNRRCSVNRRENHAIRDRVQGNLRGRSGELRQPGRRPGLLRPLVGGAAPAVAPIAPGGRGVFERFRQNPASRLPGMPGASRTPGQGLSGRPGFAGRPGMPGLPGRPGTTGVPGMTGRPGMPGVPGTPNIPGITPGRPGTPGMTGRPGMPGVPNLPGRTITPERPKRPDNATQKFRPR